MQDIITLGPFLKSDVQFILSEIKTNAKDKQANVFRLMS